MAQTPATNIEAIRGYIEKYDKTLIHQMLNELDVAKDLPVRRNVREPLQLNKMTVDSGARPLNTDIELSKGGRVWTKRTLSPQRAMKIIKVVPEELRETFQSELLDINATEIPFAAWVWAQEFAKIGEEINDNFYFSSFHGEPVVFSASATYAANVLVYFNEVIYKNISGSTTTAGQSPASTPAKWLDVDNAVICDGPDTLIKKAIATEGLLVAGSGGAFDEESAYDAFLDQWSVVSEAHKNKGMVAHVSFSTQQDLAINVNKLFGSGVGIGAMDVEEGKEFTLKGTGGRLKIKACTWMKDSRRIIISHPGNLIVGMNQVSDVNKVGKMVDTLHGYRAIVKWMIGCQFRDLENLYVNDQS